MQQSNLPEATAQAEPEVASNVEFVRGLVEALIANGRLEMPVLPEVAARVVAMASNAGSDAQQLSRLITNDQALASHVMRVASAAAFQPTAPITSLQHAIAWLGMPVVADIAFTVAVQGKVLNVPGHKAQVAGMWRESVCAGLWAREIAGMVGSNVDSAYLHGLLHEIGKPIVLQAVAEVSQRTRAPLTSEELARIVSEYQDTVGERVVREWGLAEPMPQVVRFWRSPQAATSHRLEVRTVALAHRLADFALNDDSEFASDVIRADELITQLKLKPGDVTNLFNRTERLLAQVKTY